MKPLQKVLIWIAVIALVALVILLPVIIITGMFGGDPLAGMIALASLTLFAFGVAWYVRTHGLRD
jgi:TRAP-type C4-dicarboxylate transport system permease small subunit